MEYQISVAQTFILTEQDISVKAIYFLIISVVLLISKARLYSKSNKILKILFLCTCCCFLLPLFLMHRHKTFSEIVILFKLYIE